MVAAPIRVLQQKARCFSILWQGELDVPAGTQTGRQTDLREAAWRILQIERVFCAKLIFVKDLPSAHFLHSSCHLKALTSHYMNARTVNTISLFSLLQILKKHLYFLYSANPDKFSVVMTQGLFQKLHRVLVQITSSQNNQILASSAMDQHSCKVSSQFSPL